jgi:hypothetical protein
MAESVDELGYQAKFTEGFDTADLKEAKALLDELS